MVGTGADPDPDPPEPLIVDYYSIGNLIQARWLISSNYIPIRAKLELGDVNGNVIGGTGWVDYNNIPASQFRDFDGNEYALELGGLLYVTNYRCRVVFEADTV